VDPAKEELVLCVHGLTRNARDFDMVAVKLVTANPNFRVVSVDMPGRGHSDWLKAPTGKARMIIEF
jgi:pimeloyl-ACP methyl ester carboxylesterase